MKIAIDARILYTSTGRYVERLLHHLQLIDHDNHYLVLLLRKDYERWEPVAPNFRKVVADFAPYTWREQFQLAWLLYGLRVDLVHFTMPQQPLLYLRPHVTTVHDLTLIDYVNKRRQGWLRDLYKQFLKPAAFRLAMRFFTHSSRQVITPTNFVRQQVHQRFGMAEQHISVTYEAAEVVATKEAAYEPLAGRKFILYVGNAYPYKNLEQLIEAYRLLDRPEYSLVLTGKIDYFYQQLQAQIERQAIAGVVFTDFVSDEVLAWLYRQARAYVFPSLSEGFGLPALEAMLYDLPVASSNATSLPEVYGEAAHYFDPRDAQDMAARIAEVLDDVALRQRLIRAGQTRLSQFSWQRMAEQTLEVYRRALGGARR